VTQCFITQVWHLSTQFYLSSTPLSTQLSRMSHTALWPVLISTEDWLKIPSPSNSVVNHITNVPQCTATLPCERSMSLLVTVKPKCTLAASHAATWWVTLSVPTGRTDGRTWWVTLSVPTGRTDGRTPDRYVRLLLDAASVISSS